MKCLQRMWNENHKIHDYRPKANHAQTNMRKQNKKTIDHNTTATIEKHKENTSKSKKWNKTTQNTEDPKQQQCNHTEKYRTPPPREQKCRKFKSTTKQTNPKPTTHAQEKEQACGRHARHKKWTKTPNHKSELKTQNTAKLKKGMHKAQITIPTNET